MEKVKIIVSSDAMLEVQLEIQLNGWLAEYDRRVKITRVVQCPIGKGAICTTIFYEDTPVPVKHPPIPQPLFHMYGEKPSNKKKR